MVDKWLVETDLSDEWDFYTRANVGEVFPDPVAPLSFFYFQHDDPEGGRILGGSEMGFRNAYYRIGVMTPDELPDDQCVFLGITGGYAYLNASALRMLGHRAPNMTAKDIDDAFFGDAPGVPEFVVKPGFDRPDLTEKIAETFGWVLTTPNLPDVLEHERLVDGLHSSRPDLAAMSDAELIDHAFRLADAHFEMLFGEHIFVTFLATLPLGIITAVCNAVGQPTAVLKLLAGLGDVESAAPSMAMWDLGRMVVDSPSLTASFDTGYRGLHSRLLDRSDDPDVAAFLERFADFTYHYGCRGPNEWETRSPTWETEPDLALAAIDRMRLSDPAASPHAHNADRAAEREALGDEIAAMLDGDPDTQAQFRAALHSATVFMPGRERTKTNCVKLIHEWRVAFHEFGRRRVADGTFNLYTDFGLLRRDELREAVSTRASSPTNCAGARRCSTRWKRCRNRSCSPADGPTCRRTRGAMRPRSRGWSRGESVQGIPGCPGIAKGIARVVTDSHDPTRWNRATSWSRRSPILRGHRCSCPPPASSSTSAHRSATRSSSAASSGSRASSRPPTRRSGSLTAHWWR